jgi:hypothetical protein
MFSTMRHLVVTPQNPATAFAAELGMWDWLGLVYGRHFRKGNELVTGK